MTTFLLFFLCFFSSAQSFVVPHRVWLANTSQSDEFSHFVLHWIEKTDLAPVASAPLVIDADLDGSLDLFFATADGSLHGILQFMKCSVYDKRCNEIQHNWPVVLHGESFVSSPVPVRVDYAPVIIMFTSHRGGLWGFDCWGNIKVRFQLPDMWLDEEVTKRGLPVTDRRTLTEHLRWASTDRTADMDVKGIYRLQPTIYATPLAPVGTAHQRNLNTKESDVLILAVNFISSPDIRSLEGGIVVSGLVGISRRMLTADEISSTESLRRERAIHWVPLELDWLNASQPPYLFASPVIVADLPNFDHVTGKHRDQTRVTFSVLVPSFSGRLHRIPLPLANDELDSVRGFSWTTAQSPFTQECIPLDCQPTQTEIGRAYSPSQAGVAKLCCLLLDASSRLRLVDVSRTEPLPSAGNGLPQDVFKQSVVWDYRPAVHSNETWGQVGQVSLAPGCEFKFQSNCSLWAVYPTPDGFVHAVDIPTGSIPLGYPVKLSDVTEMSVGSPPHGFSHGSGQLYVGSDSMFWMVFSDARGWLYHLRLFSPMVKISSVCPDGSLSCFQHEGMQNPSKIWHSPALFALDSSDVDCAGSRRIGLLQLGSKGVSFLTSDLSDCYLSSPKKRRLLDIRPPAHQFLHVSLFDASFAGTDGKPASRLAFSAEPSALSFRIQHCPRSARSLLSSPFEDEGNLSLQSPYLVRLLNPLGIPISDWSPTTLLPASKSFLANLTDCHGNAYLTHPLGGLYSGQVHLLIVNAATGRILTGPPSLASHSDIGASANLLLNSLWLQLVPLMVYLPGVYLFVGLAFVHGLAVSDPPLFSLPFISTYRRVKRPAQTA